LEAPVPPVCILRGEFKAIPLLKIACHPKVTVLSVAPAAEPIPIAFPPCLKCNK
jgi:hypothetical protein